MKAKPSKPFIHTTQTHFDELDALWVLHHSRFLKHLERAQQAFFNHLNNTTVFDPEKYPDTYVLVRKIEIDYLQPLKGVIPFQIRLSVSRLREAGLTQAFEFRSESGDVLFAKGSRTVCKMSSKTQAPTGWTPAFREQLETWLDL